MYWVNFLHIYQPPTQRDSIIRKIVRESYDPLISGLEKDPDAKITLNINSVLTEHLIRLGFKKLVVRLITVAERGQIEFTESGKYHPLLPLLSEQEVIRQVKLNHDTNRRLLGSVYKPKGFFCPEMAFSSDVGGILKKLGYKWVLVDQISAGREVHFNTKFRQQGLDNFFIFFRNRNASNVFAKGVKSKGWLWRKLEGTINKEDSYLITAVDGETFGHHIKGFDDVLFDFYKEKRHLKPTSIARLFKSLESEEVVAPVTATWSTNEKDLEHGVPFPLWKHPKNAVHGLQWELTHEAITAVHGAVGHPNYGRARRLLDQALHSDQYWWAACASLFKRMVTWSEEMIMKGADMLLECTNLVTSPESKEYKNAEKTYKKLKKKVFSSKCSIKAHKKRKKLKRPLKK